ncbi:MAG TPA: NYN domain-containing protein [Anaerolineales bacterium]|nr:NYN domain-containing protein [Anaerolineales bacterium]
MSEHLALFIDFENIAIWAGEKFFDFDLTRLLEYLRGRGRVVVKRAYADWGRFNKYQEEMLNNSIDLIQIYSVRGSKNRADIRLSVDAFETTITHPEIDTIVVVSGDSDFGILVTRLREYGRYVLGIGPRDITHTLLVKSCDEFVFLETIFSAPQAAQAASSPDQAEARQLLIRAISAFGQRGELPVLAAKLKHTMLSIDPTFNEANFGYVQFKAWLEANQDVVRLHFKDLQLYVTPRDFGAPANGQLVTPAVLGPASRLPAALPVQAPPDAFTHYQRLYNKMVGSPLSVRRDVLRDIYRELTEHPGLRTPDELLDMLRQRYSDEGLARSRASLQKIYQMGFRQRAYDFDGKVSMHTQIRLVDDIFSEAGFIRRTESGFVYAILNNGFEIDLAEIAGVLVEDCEQTEYVQSLLDDLEQRNLIERIGEDYHLPGSSAVPFRTDPYLDGIFRDIEAVEVPPEAPIGVEAAHSVARTALVQHSQDFEASVKSYLAACRIMLDAFTDKEPNASLEDLRWLIASYASAKAGELSQVEHDYRGARNYYLAFFALVQEDDPLWDRMRGLINPMLSYYWLNLYREEGLIYEPLKSPASIAVQLATSENEKLRQKWLESTQALASINPGLLRRIAAQIELLTGVQESEQVASQIDRMLEASAPMAMS